MSAFSAPLKNVSRETIEKLKQYEKLLLKWNEAFNLIGPESLRDPWQRHFIDSAQISPLISAEENEIVDLGTGAGFPGLVIAILFPEKKVTLVDSNHKKCRFLEKVAEETQTNVEVICSNIKDIKDKKFDLALSRGLANLNLLLTLSYPVLKKEGRCLFLKGQQHKKEIQEAQKNWIFEVGAHQSITHSAGQILHLSKIASKQELQQ